MAQFELHGFDDLMMQLDRLGRTDEVAPKMLEEAVPILQEEVVSQAEKHRDTGEMAASIKPTKVTKSADGSGRPGKHPEETFGIWKSWCTWNMVSGEDRRLRF